MVFPADPDIDDLHTEGGTRFQWTGTTWKEVNPTAVDVDVAPIVGLTALDVQTAIAELLDDITEIAALGGVFVGSAATYDALPDQRQDASPLQAGDLSILTTDDDPNDAGWYAWDGADWVFVSALPGSFPTATTTTSGVVELATNAEAVTGTDAVRAVTPAALAAGVPAHETVTSISNTGSLIEYVDEAGDDTDLDLRTPSSATLPADGATNRLHILIGHATLPDGAYAYNGHAWFQL